MTRQWKPVFILWISMTFPTQVLNISHSEMERATPSSNKLCNRKIRALRYMEQLWSWGSTTLLLGLPSPPELLPIGKKSPITYVEAESRIHMGESEACKLVPGTVREEELTVIIRALKNMFTMYNCRHRETLWLFDVESTVGGCPRPAHCAPHWKEADGLVLSRTGSFCQVVRVNHSRAKQEPNEEMNGKDCKTWMEEMPDEILMNQGFLGLFFPSTPHHSCLNTVWDIPPAYKLLTFMIRLMQ